MKFLKCTLLLVAVVLFSCSKSSDKLAESIPVDAHYVACINLESMIKKSDYNIFENATLKKAINMAKAFMKDQGAVKLIEDFQKNPNAFGVTLNKELYFFLKDSYFGFLMPVDDSGKIKESLTKFGVEKAAIKEEKGMFTVSMASEVNVVWNGEKLLFLMQMPTPMGVSKTMKQLSAEKLLTQDKKESILSNENFNKFLKEKQDLSFYYSTGVYTSMISSLNPSLATALTKMSEKFKGTSVGSFVSFEKGKIAAHAQYYFENSNAEKSFKNLTKETLGEISDKYLQYISQAPILSFAGNLKGSGYYKLFEETGFFTAFDTLLKEQNVDLSIDLRSLLKSINGNVVISLNEMSSTPQEKKTDEMNTLLPEESTSPKVAFKLSVLAELAPNNKIGSFIDTLVAKGGSEMVKKGGDGQYSLKMDNTEGFFGVKNNTFYLTTEPSVVSSVGGAPVKNSYADKTKGKIAYFYSDFRPLKKFFLGMFDANASADKQLASDGLSLIETMEGYMNPDFTNEFSINFTNKKDNSLASIFKYLDSVLNQIGARQGL